MDDDLRSALSALSATYAEAADRRDVERFCSVFEPEGVLETVWPDTDDPPNRIEGHKRLRRVPRVLERWASTVHAVGEAEYRSDSENEATGEVECRAHHFAHTPDGIVDTVMEITYHDRYRRASENWLISHRRVEIHRVADSPFD